MKIVVRIAGTKAARLAPIVRLSLVHALFTIEENVFQIVREVGDPEHAEIISIVKPAVITSAYLVVKKNVSSE